MASLAPSPTVYKAINAVMAGLTKDGIGKTRQSGSGGGASFQFRGIDEVMNALSAQLVVHKLVMLPRVLSRTSEVRQSNANKPIFVSFVEVEFDLVAVEDGSTHTIRTIGEAMDSSDKSSNKAMSAAYKYAALQAFCVPTQGMDDADATTHELADVAPKQVQQQPKQERVAIAADGKVVARRDPGEPPKGWGAWTDELLDNIKATFDEDKLNELLDANREYARGVKKVDVAMFNAIKTMVETQREIIADATPPF